MINKNEFSEYQKYLFHNLAMHHDTYYLGLLKNYQTEFQSSSSNNTPTHKLALDKNTATGFFEYLCHQATQSCDPENFHKWVNKQVGGFVETAY